MLRKTITLLAVLTVFLLSASIVSAHHQKAGNVVIEHTGPPVVNFIYEGNMKVSEVHDLLTIAPPGSTVILDIRSPWERNGSVGGGITHVSLGIEAFSKNAGVPYWRSINPAGNKRGNKINIPVHVQGPIGIAFNAQTSDGTDLVGWPFRAVGYMIMNPDFDNYMDALKAEEIVENDSVIIVMSSHGWRSKYVADYLNGLGYKKVYNMWSGFVQWNESGLPASTSEADWISWDRKNLYDPARLDPYGGPKWTNSRFIAGGDPVIPEWFGDYAPPNSELGYSDPACPAPGNMVGFNGPWPRDKILTDLNISPTLTRIAVNPSGWTGPTLSGGIVPGYFDEWPIENGHFIEGSSLPVRGEDDPCGDMFTNYFGPGMFPLQPACEKLKIITKAQMRKCNPGDPLCSGKRTYCYAMPPFGSGFFKITVEEGKFWYPGLPWNVAGNIGIHYATGP